MVDALLTGKAARDQRHQDLQQRVKVVPSTCSSRSAVDLANWKKVLIGSGYYKEEQLK
jgi:putative multiple sugar transport system substrate-binding protein